MLASHYAPRKPLVLLQRALPRLESGDPGPIVHLLRDARRVALLVQSGTKEEAHAELQRLLPRELRDVIRIDRIEVLAPGGDPVEAAQNLFASLRALDDSDAELLLAEPWENPAGLGHAIADRLGRAAGTPQSR
jgi:hypothetical protein